MSMGATLFIYSSLAIRLPLRPRGRLLLSILSNNEKAERAADGQYFNFARAVNLCQERSGHSWHRFSNGT